jgi:hypothetical protein
MRNKLYLWSALLTFTLIASCYPKGAEYTEELDLVATNYDQSYDFKSKHTYAIPDSVIKITGDAFEDPDGNGKPDFVASSYSIAIINQIKQDMQANGWTLVNKNNNPDVILLAAAMTTTNIYYYYDWSYWGWYYPGFYPGWGWYYPGYYPPYVTGYRSGSVLIQMTNNVPHPVAGENISVVWNAILNGLAEGSTASITTRIQSGINQAFAQSPYLKIN